MNTTSGTGTTLSIFAGIIIWAAHFTFIYGLTALACARGFAQLRVLDVSIVVWAIGTATVIAAAATLPLIAPALRSRSSSFEQAITASVSALALIAVVWEGMSVLIVPVCG